MHEPMYPFSSETMEFRQAVWEATQMTRRARKMRLAGDIRGAAREQAASDRMLASVDGRRS